MEKSHDKEIAINPEDEARRATTAAGSGASESPQPADIPPAAPRAKGGRGQKIALAAVAVFSVVIIGVSAVFLMQPGAASSVGAANEGQGQAKEASPSVAQGGNDSSADSQGGSSSKPEGESPSEASPAIASEVEAADAPSSNESSGEGAASPAPSPDMPSSSGGASAPSSAPASTITVSISIDSSVVGSPVSGATTLQLSPGATVYDALMSCGLSVNANGSTFGTYVSAIGGLAEKEHGGMSGWQYAVNGSTPGISCSAFKLSDGDAVSWFYALQ